MRLDKETLYTLTNRRRISAQVRWFREQFGVDVPFDRNGPIMTDAAYEKLLERRLGLVVGFNNKPESRPTIVRHRSA